MSETSSESRDDGGRRFDQAGVFRPALASIDFGRSWIGLAPVLFHLSLLDQGVAPVMALMGASGV